MLQYFCCVLLRHGYSQPQLIVQNPIKINKKLSPENLENKVKCLIQKYELDKIK